MGGGRKVARRPCPFVGVSEGRLAYLLASQVPYIAQVKFHILQVTSIAKSHTSGLLSPSSKIVPVMQLEPVEPSSLVRLVVVNRDSTRSNYLKTVLPHNQRGVLIDANAQNLGMCISDIYQFVFALGLR